MGRELRAFTRDYTGLDMSDLHSASDAGLHDFADTRSVFSGPSGGTWLQEQWGRCVTVLETGSEQALVDTLASLSRQLAWYKRNSAQADWVGVLSLARAHPLYRLLSSDPFVSEAREAMHPLLAEPQLLEFLFGGIRARRTLALAEPLGRRICGYNCTTRRSRAIRRLRVAFGEEVVQAVAERPMARIAAVGCGYLRELDAVPWYPQSPLGQFVAIDRNHEITARVRRMFLHDKLKSVAAHMWEIARFGVVVEGVTQTDFDLIYSMSALDAADDTIAEKLLDKLADLLAPGGRLVLCNSKPLTPDIAFQEAFLGQKPNARNRTDIDLLLRRVRARRDLKVSIEDNEGDEFIRIVVERYRLC